MAAIQARPGRARGAESVISKRQLSLALANVLMSRGRFGKLPQRPMKSQAEIKALVAKANGPR